MNDKKITKKWWFWVIVALLILGVFGALAQTDSDVENSSDNSQQATSNNSRLPMLSTDGYKGKEGLIVYKELKDKGYNVSADFENEALTDMNGEASDLFEKLDAESTEDRQSVDAFVVDKLVQDADNVSLSIVLQPTN